MGEVRQKTRESTLATRRATPPQAAPTQPPVPPACGGWPGGVRGAPPRAWEPSGGRPHCPPRGVRNGEIGPKKCKNAIFLVSKFTRKVTSKSTAAGAQLD